MRRSSFSRRLPIRLCQALILLSVAWVLALFWLYGPDELKRVSGFVVSLAAWIVWLPGALLTLRRSQAPRSRTPSGPLRPPEPAQVLTGVGSEAGSTADALASLRGSHQRPRASPAAMPAPSSPA